MLRIRDVYPGSRIRIFPSLIPDPGSKRSGSASKNSIQVFLSQKIVSKHSQIRFGMFKPYPDLDFYPSRIQGSKRHGSKIHNTAIYWCEEPVWEPYKVLYMEPISSRKSGITWIQFVSVIRNNSKKERSYKGRIIFDIV